MKALIEYIVKTLVGQPDEVVVKEELDNNNTILKLKVASEDIGRIIGKNGKTIKAIQQLLSAAANKSRLKTILIIDE